MPSGPDLVITASIAAGVLALLWVVRVYARRRLKQAPSSEANLDDFLLDLAEHTKLLLLFLPAVYLGIRTIEDFPASWRDPIRTGATLSLIAQSAIWLTGSIGVWIRSYRRTRLAIDPAAVTTVNAFRIGMVTLLWVIATVAALDNLGFEARTLIAGLGIGGIAVALATQNILADLFASLSIVIDKPFVLGDPISVDHYSGIVEHIGLKTTRLRSPDGEELILSNSDLLKSRIRNFRGLTERRSVVRLSFPSTTPPEKLERIPLLLQAAVEKHPQTRFGHAYLVSIGEKAQYELVYHVTSADEAVFLATQQAVGLDVLRGLGAEGVGVG